MKRKNCLESRESDLKFSKMIILPEAKVKENNGVAKFIGDDLEIVESEYSDIELYYGEKLAAYSSVMK